MRCILIAGMLFLGAGRDTLAADSATAEVPPAEAQKWVKPLSSLVGAHMWTVTAKGSEIMLVRKEPVEFQAWLPNGPANGKQPKVEVGKHDVRFVLRFAPKLSFEEYERLAAVNAASEKEHARLRASTKLPYKFDDLLATTPEEKQRLREYRAAVARLPRHHLPEFYTLDHSVYLQRSWHLWWTPRDESIRAEIQTIEDDLIRYLGMYDIRAASGGRSIGDYLELPQREAGERPRATKTDLVRH